MWHPKAGAEASVKFEEGSTPDGAGSDELGQDKGYAVHLITDEGLSVTWTVGIISVKPAKLKE